MSGFSSIAGFVFVFFAIITVFGGIYITYNQQIIKENNLIDNKLENYPITNEKFELNNLQHDSENLSFDILNTGKQELYFKDKYNNIFCFTVFFNDKLISNKNISIKSSDFDINSYDKYKFIEKDKILTIELNNQKLESQNNLLYISCSGKKNLIKFYDNLTII